MTSPPLSLPLISLILLTSHLKHVTCWPKDHIYFDPTFYSVLPQNTSALIGSKVTLYCSLNASFVSQDPADKGEIVSWTRDRFGLGMKRPLPPFRRLTMVGSNERLDYHLQIEDVQLEDDAIYECQIVSRAKRTRPIHLTVQVPPKRTSVLLASPPSTSPTLIISKRRVVENEPVNFTCLTSGARPPAKIKWFDHNDNEIEEKGEKEEEGRRDQTNQSSEGDDANANVLYYRRIHSFSVKQKNNSKLFDTWSTLTITPVRYMDDTVIRCESENEGGKSPINGEIYLSVDFAPSVSIVSDMTRDVKEGQNIGFSCVAISKPPPSPNKFKWFISSPPPHSSIRYLPNASGPYYHFRNISRQLDGSQLKCSAENAFGVASASRLISIFYPPKIVVHPGDRFVDRGGSVTLNCVSDSNPPSKYTWVRLPYINSVLSHSQNLTLNATTLDLSEGSGIEGRYQCLASSGYFKTVASSYPAEVRINSPPVISANTMSTQFTNDVQLKSGNVENRRVAEGMENDDVRRDFHAHIDCAARSSPPPHKIFWSHTTTGQLVAIDNMSRFRVVNTAIDGGMRSTLVIKNPARRDFKTYTCHFQNRFGETKFDVSLRDTEPFSITFIAVVGISVVMAFILFISLITCFMRASHQGVGGRRGKSSVGGRSNKNLHKNNKKLLLKDHLSDCSITTRRWNTGLDTHVLNESNGYASLAKQGHDGEGKRCELVPSWSLRRHLDSGGSNSLPTTAACNTTGHQRNPSEEGEVITTLATFGGPTPPTSATSAGDNSLFFNNNPYVNRSAVSGGKSTSSIDNGGFTVAAAAQADHLMLVASSTPNDVIGQNDGTVSAFTPQSRFFVPTPPRNSTSDDATSTFSANSSPYSIDESSSTIRAVANQMFTNTLQRGGPQLQHPPQVNEGGIFECKDLLLQKQNTRSEENKLEHRHHIIGENFANHNMGGNTSLSMTAPSTHLLQSLVDQTQQHETNSAKSAELSHHSLDGDHTSSQFLIGGSTTKAASSCYQPPEYTNISPFHLSKHGVRKPACYGNIATNV